ncbi:ABC-2 family transporter protein [Paenibacillus thiaminolyticus]|uniref:ABC transporter permease n=1 Tax=Paenibacillus thiaminolyticus TaxID=49283 RepID=A0AAP9J3E6_PANTH|nr:ABC-2 family transporter protein [Paenibacillus thiaminolyticus]MCY9536664.1 ABC-2 family transporter protein [Paenibacillus thiaminolyticus]MCY9601957.1 ABC-2 family transporter protein [Paenibacillus thiaminolyticus]MCY9609840.1 ABC-2 family transporter protein [Paenibacillus thiaminolyticus]MCY9613784.1 ABC-2 family transporter protein [Paenibacillus thiaminolyticus]MCY9620686.1 ABC-2 family transporter protein [Paenibacillus thiaminolyticus]
MGGERRARFRDAWRTGVEYMRLYGVFIRNCLAASMEYRFNFWMGIAVEIAFLCAKALYILIVYQTNLHIGKLTPDHILLFIGTYTMMTGFYMGLFYVNFIRLQQYVRDGTLDLMLTKPISLQFLVSLRYVDIGLPVPNVLAGAAMIAVGWSRAGLPLNAANLVGFAGLLLAALAVTYGLMLLPALLAFRFVQTGAVTEIAHSIWDANNMPLDIFPPWLQRIGIYAIPVFLISNYAPKFVMNELSAGDIAWAAAAPLLLLLLARWCWKRAVSGYSSAGS